MKFMGYLLAVVIIGIGLVFLSAAPRAITAPRLIMGTVMIAGGIGLIVALRLRVPEKRTQITQQIDLTGDVHLEAMHCKNCGGTLDRNSVSLQEGAIFVTCPFCRSSYQIEEEPKW